jgi:hypothetical protein
VNEAHGDLVWFAFTTSSAAVKGMFLVSTWQALPSLLGNPSSTCIAAMWLVHVVSRCTCQPAEETVFSHSVQ